MSANSRYNNKSFFFFLALSIVIHCLFVFTLQNFPKAENSKDRPGHIMLDLASALRHGASRAEKASAKAVQQYSRPDALPASAVPQESVRTLREEQPKAVPPYVANAPERSSVRQGQTATTPSNSPSSKPPEHPGRQEEGGVRQQASRNSAPVEASVGAANGPAFIKHVMPKYPALAKRLNREGKVMLRLSINETGALTGMEVIENPGYGFAEAAMDAVRNSTFSPARHNGMAVASRATLPVSFKLN